MATRKNFKMIAREVAADTGQPLYLCERILLSGFNAIAQTIAAEDSVTVANFGTFEAGKRAESIGRNIHTGEPLLVDARRVPRFRSTGRLKQLVRDGDTTGTITKTRSKD